MATAIQKITKRAKQLQKDKPNAKWITLVKDASKEYRAGKLGAVKKAKPKVSGVKKVVVKKVSGAPAKKKAVGSVVKSTSPIRKGVGKISGVVSGEKILKSIDRLEKKYKAARGEAKELYRLAINAEHKKLNAVKRSF
ncbi:MAG: hypothetical protein ABW007_02120 [Chitinophagaceae bacterium]